MEPSPDLMFHCPACGVRLRLPPELMGVSGPCPSCGEWIRSPAPLPLRPRALPQGAGAPGETPPVGAETKAPVLTSPALEPTAAGTESGRARRRGRVSPLGAEQWSAIDQRESKRTVVVLILFLAAALLVYLVNRILAGP